MTDMTDFDKLIKEKAEQASYPYDEAAWRKYKRAASLKSGTVKYWVLGAASIVTVSAVLLLKQGHQVQPASEQPLHPVVFTEDSVSVSQNLSTDLPDEDTVALPVVCKPENGSHQTFQHPRETADGYLSSMKNDTLKVSKKVIYGRPIVIDVDTITRMVPTDEELEKGHSRLY